MKKWIIILLCVYINIEAQIDTTDWYPLHIGDKWEYYGQGFGYSKVEVIGDTLMQNGKTYFVLTLYDRKYQRVVNNRYVMVYNENVENSEFIEYDLLAKEKNIFILEPNNTGGYYGYGVYETGKDNDNLLSVKLNWKEYREVYIDSTVIPPDTVWDNTVDAYWPRITKGLGVTSYDYDLTTLVGAVINGVGYGTLVSVHENTDIVDAFKLYQNYPNPFNPITIIKYSIPTESHIAINVFNTLGEKVTTLFSGRKNRGEYSVEFNGNNLPSGTYFIQLSANSYNKTIKAILLK